VPKTTRAVWFRSASLDEVDLPAELVPVAVLPK